MNKYIFSLLLVIQTLPSFAAIDKSKLIKVKGNKNVNCVEYFTIKGEVYCSTTSLSDITPDPNIKDYEKQYIQFDNRAWQPVWSQQDKRSVKIEYLPEGDKLDNWHEMITSRFYPGLQNKITPMELASKQIEQLNKQSHDPFVNIITSDPTYVIYEFQITQPKNEAQSEIVKITAGKNGLYILRYSIKVPKMTDKTHEDWTKNMKASHPNE